MENGELSLGSPRSSPPIGLLSNTPKGRVDYGCLCAHVIPWNPGSMLPVSIEREGKSEKKVDCFAFAFDL